MTELIEKQQFPSVQKQQNGELTVMSLDPVSRNDCESEF